MKKLVRDNIPDIIKNNGRKPDFYVAKNFEYKEELFRKLLEEVNEVIEEKENKKNLAEELADLMEVYLAILKLEHISIEEIEKIRKEKLQKRGGFDKKIILKIK